MSPTQVIVRTRELNLALDNARLRKDEQNMEEPLRALTILMHKQFGTDETLRAAISRTPYVPKVRKSF